ncbi:ABC transporter permease [Actinoplanes sp. NPDC051494]|uniref:ABC transporter permease n=1 Tax=Actinoplanes sp. NPDC051494 TaxID=3363907 RepID=UPI003793B17D
MSDFSTAARTGFARGGIEIRQTFTNLADLWQYIFPAVALFATVFFMRGSTVPGTDIALGARTLPSALGMGVAFSGLVTVAMLLVTDREDGTLLRAKATPNGMSGYLVGKVVLVGGMSAIALVLQLIPGLFLVDGLHLDAYGVFTLVWVLLLGFVATMPLGAVLGSLFKSPRSMGLIMLPLVGLIAISGVFYPITVLPGWVQGVAQVFPVYWLGLGMRSAFLPDALTVSELGHSWRHLETFGVLGLWAAAGLVVAPVILRRMARRESGSAVAARREKAMLQVR